MSDQNLARRVKVKVYIEGVDVTPDVENTLISLSYTDNELDETDDLQLKLQDRDDVWLQAWLNPLVQAAAASEYDSVDAAGGIAYTVTAGSGLNVRSGPGTSYSKLSALSCGATASVLSIENGWAKISYNGAEAYAYATYLKEGGNSNGTTATADAKGLRMQAMLIRENWTGDGKDDVLDCGEFELDSVTADGPPSVVTIKGTSLPYRNSIRQTKKSKAWEGYTLSGVAKEMADANGMGCEFLSDSDLYFERTEQVEQSDIAFLSELCECAGVSLKVTSNCLVLFDQAVYESKDAIRTFTKGDGSYTKYKLGTGASDTQYSACQVSYTDSDTGKVVEHTYKLDDADEEDEDYQVLEIREKVTTTAEAEALAKKMLRLKNKFEHTADLSIPGDTAMVAGVTVMLTGFGMFDGKYLIYQAKHSVSNGYITQIKLRRVLEGY